MMTTVVKTFAMVLVMDWVTAEIPEIANPEVRSFLENYDRSQPPPNGSTNVRTGIYVNAMRLFPKQSILELIIYFRVSWNDERLLALLTEEEKQQQKRKRIEFPAHKYFWKPDLFFRNQREVVQRGAITDEALLFINHNGDVWYVTAHVNTFYCPWLPRVYTYDMPTVECPVMIESYAHTMDNIILTWLGSPVDVDPSVVLEGFTLSDIILYDCSQNYTAGAFPCLEIRFILKRDSFNDHVGDVLYVSSFLLVVAAWTSFWLDGVRDTVKRLILGFGATVLLALELAGAATWYEEWDLLANKAQFWLAFCVLMASFTVVELAVVHVAMVNCLDKLRGAKSGEPVQVTSEGQEMEKCEGTVGRIIDVVFGLVLYPAIFIIFGFVFFIKHYQIMSEKTTSRFRGLPTD